MIKVLIVDDSALIRRLIRTVLDGDPEIEVVGSAHDGQDAIQQVRRLQPDVVTLDIEMPVMDGLEALEQLQAEHPGLPVIMFSTLTHKGAAKTLRALSLGAADFVTKPSQSGTLTESISSVRRELLPKIKALAAIRTAQAAEASLAPSEPVRLHAAAPTSAPQVLVVGSSTGGTEALVEVLGAMGADFALPTVIVQHMPPLFTDLFAQRLNRVTPFAVREARDGDPLAAGQVLIAPGGHHVVFEPTDAGVVLRYDDGPPENFCRPAVDVLFRSAVDVFGSAVLGCVLTGMGRDGERGAGVVVGAGGQVVVQDQATSVVWGMPGAVAKAGFASAVVPLGQIGAELRDRAMAPSLT